MQVGSLPSAPLSVRVASLDMSWLGRCSESLLTLDLTDCVALDVKVPGSRVNLLTTLPVLHASVCSSVLVS